MKNICNDEKQKSKNNVRLQACFTDKLMMKQITSVFERLYIRLIELRKEEVILARHTYKFILYVVDVCSRLFFFTLNVIQMK